MLEFNFYIIYRPDKQNIKFDNLTKRIKNLFENKNDDRIQYRYRTILKNDNLNEEIKNAIQMTSLLLNEIRENLTYLITIMYELNE